jgi:hypothetical protein
VSATVPTGLELGTLEFTLKSNDDLEEFPEELVRSLCAEWIGVQLAVVGMEAMRWVTGAGESGGVEQLAAPFGMPVIQAAQAGGLTNHHKPGDAASFNGVRGLWASRPGAGVEPAAAEDVALPPGATAQQTASPRREEAASPSAAAPAPATGGRDAVADLFSEFLQRGRELMGGREGGPSPSAEPVLITGAALGLAGGTADDGLAPVRAAGG